MNTDTPRTDAEWSKVSVSNYGGIPTLTEFDRKLERELRTAQHHTAEVLAACDAAAMCDTEEMYAKADCPKESSYWSEAYESVRRRTKECIELRKERDQVAKNCNKLNDENNQLRAEVERLKGSHGYDADYWFEEYEGQRKLAIDLSFKCDQWREDAKRLANVFEKRTNHGGNNFAAGCDCCEALAAHERLVQEAKK